MNKISDELAAKIIKKAISKGGDYADVFIEHKQHVSIQLDDNKIEKIVSGIDAGIGIRVIFRGKSAYAYSNDFSEDSLFNLAETVSKAAKDGKDTTINLKKIKPRIDFMIKLSPQ